MALNELEVNAITMLVQGESKVSVAKALGVSRGLLYRMLEKPEVKKEKERLEQSVLDETFALALEKTRKALEDSENPFFALNCLQTLSKYRLSTKTEIVSKNMNLDMLLEDL